MIAQRLRPIGWVAAVAVAALGFYLVSLRVASEREALEAVDMRIVAAKRDIRRLQTELGARASLRQLEQWNGDVLALSAPTADQYLVNETQLAALDGDFRLASAQTGQTARPVPRAVLTHAVAHIEAPVGEPARGSIAPVAVKPEASAPVPEPRLQRVAMLDETALLDKSTLIELSRAAARESGDRPR